MAIWDVMEEKKQDMEGSINGNLCRFSKQKVRRGRLFIVFCFPLGLPVFELFVYIIFTL